jgi:hypothetical protein
MTLFDGLLFSTSALSVPGDIYYYCKKKEDVAKYDLCTAVVNDLTQKAIKWKKRDVAKYDLCTAVVNDLTQKAIKWKKRGVNERTGAISVQGCVALIMVMPYFTLFSFCTKYTHVLFSNTSYVQ